MNAAQRRSRRDLPPPTSGAAALLMASALTVVAPSSALARASAGEVGAPSAAATTKREKKEKKKKAEKKPDRLEFGGLPATNYDSDLGVGFGVIATLAKFSPGYRPYRWRIEFLLYATAKRAPGRGVEIPFHDDYVNIDLPGLWGNRLRINSVLGFRKFSTTGYYGLGNNSRNERPWEAIDADVDPEGFTAARRTYQYDRIYPALQFNARFQVWDQSPPTHRRRLEAFVGTNFSYSLIRPYAGSKLAQDVALAQTDTEDGRTLARYLKGTDDHALWQINVGMLWDTRDHEYAPTRGTFTELSTRISPGVMERLSYAGFTLNTSWYRSLAKRYLVLAVRGIGDAIAGDAPFYELARFGAFINRDGPGGSWSVRGVPRQRYYGKFKALTNVELRSEFLPFNIRSQRFVLGAIAFVDAGRVWLDRVPVILGGQNVNGGGMKLGVGGGLRLRWGETFIVRVDPAYSITEKNFGVYIDIGHIF
jgi:hypothetical protein